MEYPSFIDNQTFLALDSSKDETAQLKAMLSNLTRVHLLCANKFDSFDELIREYLKSGTEIFGLETGIVSHIKDGTYTVCDVASPLDVLEKGQEFALEDTYCQLVYNSQAVIGLPEVGQLDYMNTHPVYQNLKLEAYLSAPIYIDEVLFGTLNFTSTQAREHGFSEHERNLILLLAHSIGGYLQLRQKERDLKQLNNQIKKFVGYVAHDLRNPLGSIITLSTLAHRAQHTPDRLERILDKISRAGESALELVTTILDSAALGRGKIELNINEISLSTLTQQAVESISEFAHESENEVVILQTPDTSRCKLDAKRILQALNNLLVNAIKYSPQRSRILLSTTNTNDGTVFKIQNKIASKKENINSRQQFNSVGFGIEIVRDILAAHNSKLIVHSDNENYEAHFLIPK